MGGAQKFPGLLLSLIGISGACGTDTARADGADAWRSRISAPRLNATRNVIAEVYMLQTARFTVLLKVCAASVVLTLACVASHAQEFSPDIRPGTLIGVPFSAVATAQTIRRTVDGNRFVRTSTTRYYRDGQGRLRVEREFDAPLVSDSNVVHMFSIVTINDRVSGEFYVLQPANKTVQVIKHPTPAGAAYLAEGSNSAPPISTSFEGTMILPTDHCWSEPVALGEKSIDGINAVGTRRVCTLAAGVVHNDKAITVTVEQWYSPTLGSVLVKSSQASTGGESLFKLDQIVQAEPDASLFTVPSDYKLITMPGTGGGIGVVTSSGSTVSATAVASSLSG
jgi:hypothetical protein